MSDVAQGLPGWAAGQMAEQRPGGRTGGQVLWESHEFVWGFGYFTGL